MSKLAEWTRALLVIGVVSYTQAWYITVPVAIFYPFVECFVVELVCAVRALREVNDDGQARGT